MSTSPLDSFKISPPLLNSSNPWATTEADLSALYSCPYTGAVTIRTSLWSGFSQHPSTHQYTFFSSSLGHATTDIDTSGAEGRGAVRELEGNSLNTLGYSPIPFETYIAMLVRMNDAGILNNPTPKPFIVSVTGTADEVGLCYTFMAKTLHERKAGGLQLMMEINLSCPNIPDKPPPAYDSKSLVESSEIPKLRRELQDGAMLANPQNRRYINAIGKAKSLVESDGYPPLHVGIKTPPYTYPGQFRALIEALEASETLDSCPISFITATNTLGSCLVLREDGKPALGSANGEGIGGMAGEAIHALSLGNVKTIRTMLNASKHAEIRKIAIIGIGGIIIIGTATDDKEFLSVTRKEQPISEPTTIPYPYISSQLKTSSELLETADIEQLTPQASTNQSSTMSALNDFAAAHQADHTPRSPSHCCR
ncbi:Dihydroorotate dehydrogenase (fumarate) [Lachnellula occidentalis]|uniref:Dihydroorotate dehydrogenase (Fumarate) n=1 Tax=Lachnellula occidentalis TaxID=215460 RepID=A0A8H8S651_9HELO|nr:Dihydroorotate dehydrogenase (fumarate) [Lachnellula occidentalis]